MSKGYTTADTSKERLMEGDDKSSGEANSFSCVNMLMLLTFLRQGRALQTVFQEATGFDGRAQQTNDRDKEVNVLC